MVLVQNTYVEQWNRIEDTETAWVFMQLQPSYSQQMCPKHFGEKIASLTNGAGKTTYPHVED
jgi:hypothetical protein